MPKVFTANFLRKRADNSPRLLRLLWTIDSGLIAALSGLSRTVSPDRASETGRTLLRVLGPRLDKARIIRRNPQVVFPEKSESEINQLVRAVWGNFGSILAEYPHLGIICKGDATSAGT